MSLLTVKGAGVLSETRSAAPGPHSQLVFKKGSLGLRAHHSLGGGAISRPVKTLGTEVRQAETTYRVRGKVRV